MEDDEVNYWFILLASIEEEPLGSIALLPIQFYLATTRSRDKRLKILQPSLFNHMIGLIQTGQKRQDIPSYTYTCRSIESTSNRTKASLSSNYW